MNGTSSVRPAQAVAKRALCLAAQCFRGHIEAAAAGNMRLFRDTNREPTWRLHTTAARINDWLMSEQLWDSLSAAERPLFDTRLGDVDVQKLINATWRVEAIAMLLWGPCLTESILPYDTEVDLDTTLERIGFLKDTDAVVAESRLRNVVELCDAREITRLWHWRATAHQIEHEAARSAPSTNTEDEFVRGAAAKAQDAGRFVAIDGDFAAFGKPHREATEEEWRLLLSRARERHYALNWLADVDDDWDKVLGDT